MWPILNEGKQGEEEKQQRAEDNNQGEQQPMNIARREWYRNSYLKSGHWENLRLSKLVSVKGCCQICKHEAWNNDVHHVYYRNLYDVTLKDLVVLCRSCHTAVHDTLSQNQWLKSYKKDRKWEKTIKATKLFIYNKTRKSIVQFAIACGVQKLCKRWLFRKGFVDKVTNGEIQVTEATILANLAKPYSQHEPA